jgi:hypothetical protein
MHALDLAIKSDNSSCRKSVKSLKVLHKCHKLLEFDDFVVRRRCAE